jgi:hypothetical protein
MAAPKSIIEQFLEAISVIPFAGTVAEIEVARTHLSLSCAAIWGTRMPIRNFGLLFDHDKTTARVYYGDRHSMAITIAVSS